MLLADDIRLEGAAGRRQGIDRREDALGENAPVEGNDRVQVGEGSYRGRVGLVVSGHVNRLH